MKLGQGSHKSAARSCWIVMLLVAAMALPGAAFVAAKDRGKHQALVSCTYGLNDLLAVCRSAFHLDADKAQRFLADHIKSSCPGDWAHEESVAWSGNSIVVRQTAQAHETIARHLEALRKFGFAQVILEIRMIAGYEPSRRESDVDWIVVNPSSQVSSNRHDVPIANDPLDRPLPDNDSVPRVRIAKAVEKDVVAQYALLDEARAFTLRSEVKAHARANIFVAPKVTLFNGQSATISDCSQRPFIVGLTPREDGQSEPRIRVVRDGVVMRARPILQDDEKVWLDFELTLSDLVRVETGNVASLGNGRKVQIQVPEVAVTQLETSMAVPLGQSLVLAGLEQQADDGKTRSLMVLVTPRRVPREDVVKRIQPYVHHETAEKIAGLVPQFNALLDEERYAEAEVVARHAHRLDPDSNVAELMLWKATFVRRILERENKVQRAGHEVPDGVILLLDGSKPSENKPVENTPRAFDDDVQYFPPTPSNLPALPTPESQDFLTEDWDALSRRRRASESKIEQVLRDKKIACHFNDVPLNDVIAALARGAAINIVIDSRGLAAEGLTEETPVTLNLDQPVSIRSVLHLILEPLGLGFHEVNEVVRISSQSDLAGPLYVKVYNVADLVVPTPKQVIVLTEKGYESRPGKVNDAQADFDSLTELITTTIAADSWDEVGGPGAIEAFETNLSLVISQTEDVHHQTADLLEQVRRLADVSVVLNVEVIHLPQESFEEGGLAYLFVEKPHGELDAAQVELWRQFVAESGNVNVTAAPKITLFNGQSIELPISRNQCSQTLNQAPLQLVPVISADRRSVRLSVSAGAEASSEALAKGIVHVVETSKSLMVDVSDLRHHKANGIPILTKLPYVGRSFRGTRSLASGKTVVMITPQIVVREEDEQRVR